MQSLIKISGNWFERDSSLGKYPIFSLEINRRVKHKEACVIVVVGEAGTGKSYMAMQIARNIDNRFGVDQVVFTYGAYTAELQRTWNGKPIHGLPIVFDEPSYAMGKREWYKEINQALVKTIESQRFMVRPLIIPIININLLDKTLRDYLVQFQVHITKRGRGLVYRIRASQGEDKIYRYLVCRISYPVIDFDKCQIDSCLDCKKLEDCDLLRSRYERKKMAIQMARYKQDEESSKTRESKELTTEQLCTMIKPYLDICREEGIIKARLLKYYYREKLGIRVGHNKSQDIKTALELEEKHTETISA